ncbi:MAG TPA: hypothetical protein VMB81_06055 [Candidatus Sulfotelmatobacter sp.]|nr:hypothetical protein [Candidatus Sulfotelmatobacter sp.]
MRRYRTSMVILACLAALAAVVAPTRAASPPAWHPGLGDLMTMAVQPRHIKLAAAGREKNWIYAAYELGEIKEAFDDVARSVPVWESMPIATMIRSLTKAPLVALGEAIKSADPSRFEAAYGKLTDACNSCHQAANHGMIVIRVPDTVPFSDQDFRPPAR